MLVKWHDPERKELFGVVACAIEEKDAFREKGYLVFDIEDFKSEF